MMTYVVRGTAHTAPLNRVGFSRISHDGPLDGRLLWRHDYVVSWRLLATAARRFAVAWRPMLRR